MQTPPRASTSRRLLAAMGAMLLLLLASVTQSMLREGQLIDTLAQVASEDLERIALLSEINDDANEASRRLVVLLVAERDHRVHAYEEIDTANRHLDSAMLLLARHIDGGERNPQYLDLTNLLQRYREVYQATAELVEFGEIAAARAAMVDKTDVALSMLISAVQNFDRLGQQQLKQRIDALRDEMAQDRRRLIALSLAGLLLSVGLAVWIIRHVATPLRQAAGAARRLAQGDYSQRLGSGSCGEVGDIAAALNGLADGVQQREAALRRLIDIDPLTGLMQRNRFITEHAGRVQAALDGGPALALMCFDIERLKSINALLGFDAGDAAIIEVAACAVRWVDQHAAQGPGQRDQVARLGGGTLVVLVELAPRQSGLDCAQAFQQAMEHRMVWRDHTLDLSTTVGVALCPAHGDTLQALVRRAEQALFEAKRLHAAVAPYRASIEAARLSHLSLLSELQDAIARRQLVPFLQPKLCLASGRILGAEALVRWHHPQRGWIPPSEFVPFAERSGRIGSITQTMLAQCLALMGSTLPTLSVAVNVSTYDLRDPGFVDRLQALLVEHGVAPQRLQIEITESGLLDAGDDPITRLAAVRALGVSIAIDDFGTGQSSLAYLQRLPVDELKIDRSFVDGADAEPRRVELLASIVRLGHGLGLKVTAEGVETEAELAVLRAAGCDLAQGYLIARPMAVAAFMAAFVAHQAQAGETAAA